MVLHTRERKGMGTFGLRFRVTSATLVALSVCSFSVWAKPTGGPYTLDVSDCRRMRLDVESYRRTVDKGGQNPLRLVFNGAAALACLEELEIPEGLGGYQVEAEDGSQVITLAPTKERTFDGRQRRVGGGILDEEHSARRYGEGYTRRSEEALTQRMLQDNGSASDSGGGSGVPDASDSSEASTSQTSGEEGWYSNSTTATLSSSMEGSDSNSTTAIVTSSMEASDSNSTTATVTSSMEASDSNSTTAIVSSSMETGNSNSTTATLSSTMEGSDSNFTTANVTSSMEASDSNSTTLTVSSSMEASDSNSTIATVTSSMEASDSNSTTATVTSSMEASDSNSTTATVTSSMEASDSNSTTLTVTSSTGTGGSSSSVSGDDTTETLFEEEEEVYVEYEEGLLDDDKTLIEEEEDVYEEYEEKIYGDGGTGRTSGGTQAYYGNNVLSDDDASETLMEEEEEVYVEYEEGLNDDDETLIQKEEDVYEEYEEKNYGGGGSYETDSYVEEGYEDDYTEGSSGGYGDDYTGGSTRGHDAAVATLDEDEEDPSVDDNGFMLKVAIGVMVVVAVVAGSVWTMRRRRTMQLRGDFRSVPHRGLGDPDDI